MKTAKENVYADDMQSYMQKAVKGRDQKVQESKTWWKKKREEDEEEKWGRREKTFFLARM